MDKRTSGSTPVVVDKDTAGTSSAGAPSALRSMLAYETRLEQTQTRKRGWRVNPENYSVAQLRGFVFCPGGSTVWPQCGLCAVCAVGHVGCCIGGGEVPYGGKHIILAP